MLNSFSEYASQGRNLTATLSFSKSVKFAKVRYFHSSWLRLLTLFTSTSTPCLQSYCVIWEWLWTFGDPVKYKFTWGIHFIWVDRLPLCDSQRHFLHRQVMDSYPTVGRVLGILHCINSVSGHNGARVDVILRCECVLCGPTLEFCG